MNRYSIETPGLERACTFHDRTLQQKQVFLAREKLLLKTGFTQEKKNFSQLNIIGFYKNALWWGGPSLRMWQNSSERDSIRRNQVTQLSFVTKFCRSHSVCRKPSTNSSKFMLRIGKVILPLLPKDATGYSKYLIIKVLGNFRKFGGKHTKSNTTNHTTHF